jgi:hypothetical protein
MIILLLLLLVVRARSRMCGCACAGKDKGVVGADALALVWQRVGWKWMVALLQLLLFATLLMPGFLQVACPPFHLHLWSVALCSVVYVPS